MALHSQRVLLWLFNVAWKTRTYIGLHVEGLIFFPDLNQIWKFLTDFHEVPNVKCHMSSGSCVDDKRMDRWIDWWTGMRRVIGNFHDYMNAHKKTLIYKTMEWTDNRQSS